MPETHADTHTLTHPPPVAVALTSGRNQLLGARLEEGTGTGERPHLVLSAGPERQEEEERWVRGLHKTRGGFPFGNPGPQAGPE